jgi:hypothetical protein
MHNIDGLVLSKRIYDSWYTPETAILWNNILATENNNVALMKYGSKMINMLENEDSEIESFIKEHFEMFDNLDFSLVAVEDLEFAIKDHIGLTN